MLSQHTPQIQTEQLAVPQLLLTRWVLLLEECLGIQWAQLCMPRLHAGLQPDHLLFLRSAPDTARGGQLI